MLIDEKVLIKIKEAGQATAVQANRPLSMNCDL